MNQRTEEAARKPGPAFIRWTGVSLVAFMIFYAGASLFGDVQWYFMVLPWQIARGMTIEEALHTGEWVGHPYSLLFKPIYANLVLLLNFVAIPTLFLIAWRALWRQGSSRKVATACFMICGGVILVISISLIVHTAFRIKWPADRERITALHKLQLERIDLEEGLERVGLDARVYRIVPREKGGGNKNFAGYKIPARLEGHEGLHFILASEGEDILKLQACSDGHPGSSIVLEIDSPREHYVTQSMTYQGVYADHDTSSSH